MRFRLLLLSLPVLLGACSKTAAPVRLDFIGLGTLISGNKTVSPNDTLITRAYAVGNDIALKRLHISVKYEPTRDPILYPIPLSNYDPTKTPKDDPLVYLDSLVTPIYTGRSDAPRGGEVLFENRFTARSTSGTELWQYSATDEQGQTTSRAFRLTARKTDSAAVFHSYTALLRPVPAAPTPPAIVRDAARVFLSLRSGLLLPKYAVINNENSVQANQSLIDLICLGTASTVSLSAPADLNPNDVKWPLANRRATQLRKTSLSDTDFSNAKTTAAFTTAFAGGTLFPNDSLSTGTLIKNQVVAFRINENSQTYTGLILVSDLILGTAPRLTCAIKVQK